MAITAEQREKRKRYIGSSDIAAIVGADPYLNAGDLWLQKTGQLEEWEGNENTRRGERLENVALDWFVERMGMPLVRDIWLDDGDSFCANLDGATLLDGETYTGRPEELSSPVDAKTVAWIELWGESASDIPLPKILQLQWQMRAIGPHSQRGYLPVIFPGYRSFGFVTPPMVKRDNELIEGLEDQAREFLGYVRSGERPPDATPHLEALKRIRREPESIVSLDAEQSIEIQSYWDDRQVYKDKASAAETDAKGAQEQVLAMLGQSEAARLVDGSMFTYLSQNSARQTDEDLLQHRLASLQDCVIRAAALIKNASPGEALAVLEGLDAESIYGQVVKQGKHRVLRFKKPPKVKGGRR